MLKLCFYSCRLQIFLMVHSREAVKRVKQFPDTEAAQPASVVEERLEKTESIRSR